MGGLKSVWKSFTHSLKTDWPQYTGIFTVPWLAYRGVQSLQHMLHPEIPTLGQSQMSGTPSTAQGRAIPDILGTVKITGSYLWYCRKGEVPAFQKWDCLHPNAEATVFTYALGLCVGAVDEALTVYADDQVIWAGSAANPGVGVGESLEIQTSKGNIYFYFGNSDSTSDPDAGGRLLCYALFDIVEMGSPSSPSNQIASTYWVLRRTPSIPFLSDAYKAINTRDYNPAHAIAYILRYLCDVPLTMIDVASFEAAAATLASEGRGISLCMDQETTAAEYIKRILLHADAVLAFDSTLEAYTLNLKRDDVLVADMDLIDESVLLEPPSLTRSDWVDCINVATVEYAERTSKTETGMSGSPTSYNYADASASFKNAAAMALMATEKSRTVKYGLFNDPLSASWVAHRLLRQDGYPQAEVNLVLPRSYFRYSPGTLFKLSYADYGLVALVCRVVEVREIGLAEGEALEIKAVEDPEYLSSSPNLVAPTSGAETNDDNSTDLVPFDHVKFFEPPFFPSDYYGLGVCCIPCLNSTADYADIYYSMDGVTWVQLATEPQIGVYGELTTTYRGTTPTIDAEGFTVEIGQGAELITNIELTRALAGYNFALIGDEMIFFTTITHLAGDTYQISGVIRHRFDTKQVDHAAGTAFYWGKYLHSCTLILDNADMTLWSSRYFKAVPRKEGADVVSGALAEALLNGLYLYGRRYCPLTPRSIRANGRSWQATYTSDIVLTWASRIRGGGFESPSVGGAGQYRMGEDKPTDWEGTFKVAILVGGSVVRITTGIDAETWTYDAATNSADNGGLAASVTLRVYGTNGRFTSLDYDEIVVTKV